MVTPSPEQRTFLETARVGHLGTANKLGEPHVVPVCYALLDDAAYILIDRKKKRFDEPGKLKRVANILENPSVCLTVDRYAEDWSRLGFVMIRGTARLLSEGEEYEAAFNALVARYSQYRERQIEGRPMIAIGIRKISSWGVLSGPSP